VDGGLVVDSEAAVSQLLPCCRWRTTGRTTFGDARAKDPFALRAWLVFAADGVIVGAAGAAAARAVEAGIAARPAAVTPSEERQLDCRERSSCVGTTTRIPPRRRLRMDRRPGISAHADLQSTIADGRDLNELYDELQ
jgi:hypothetical protein